MKKKQFEFKPEIVWLFQSQIKKLPDKDVAIPDVL